MLGSSVGDVIVHLRLDATQFNAAMLQAHERMQKFSRALTRMGTYLTIRATIPLVLLGKNAVSAFAKFNDAIVRSAAVTRGMNQEMRKEMERTAIQLSKNSLLSATQLAEGYFALGQAGYSAAAAIKVLPVAAEFAIAATIDLDTSIRYLARTAEGLGMSMETPVDMMKSMEDVSNAFTFAAITTTAEIHDFAVAMTHAAAPALKLVNKDVKEGVAALMAFARAGIVAEEAGTLLWTTVRDLQRAYIKSKSVWMDFGLTVYDNTGKMRNLADIFADVEAKFSNMSDEAKKTTLQMLGFQDRSLRGIQALMGFSGEMKIFQEGMADMGDLTHQVSETYMKSFQARLIKLGHHLDVLRISVGRLLSPFLEVLGKRLERLTAWWDKLSDSTRMLIVEIGLVVAVAGPLLLIAGKLAMAFSIFAYVIAGTATSLVSLGVALGSVSWILLAVAVALLAVTVKLYVLRAIWLQNFADIQAKTEAVKDAIIKIWPAIRPPILSFVDWMTKLFPQALRYINEVFVRGISTLVGILAAFAETVKEIGKALVSAAGDPNLWFGGPAAIFTFTQHMATGFYHAGTESGNAFVDAVRATLPKIEEFEATVAEGAKDMAQTAAAGLGIVMESGVESVANMVTEALNDVAEVVKKQFGEDVSWVISWITEKAKKMNESLFKLMPDEELNEVLVALKKMRKEMKKLAEEGVFALEQQIRDLMKATRQERNMIGESTRDRERLSKMFELQIILEKELGVASQRSAEKQAKYNKIMGAYEEILKQIEKRRRGIQGFITRMEDWIDDASNAWQNFADLVTDSLDSFADALADFITTGEADWARFCQQLLRDWLAMQIRMQMAAILNPEKAQENRQFWTDLGQAFIGWFGGGPKTTPAPESTNIDIGPSTANTGKALAAMGAVFKPVHQGVEIIKMQAGGIVYSPTGVPLAYKRTALIGEAGPEAVMPLTRTSEGELGVKTTGMMMPEVKVENKMKIVNVLTKEEQLAAMQSFEGEQIFMNFLRRKGVL